MERGREQENGLSGICDLRVCVRNAKRPRLKADYKYSGTPNIGVLTPLRKTQYFISLRLIHQASLEEGVVHCTQSHKRVRYKDRQVLRRRVYACCRKHMHMHMHTYAHARARARAHMSRVPAAGKEIGTERKDVRVHMCMCMSMPMSICACECELSVHVHVICM